VSALVLARQGINELVRSAGSSPDKLLRFLEHPGVLAHNNRVENDIRPFAVGGGRRVPDWPIHAREGGIAQLRTFESRFCDAALRERTHDCVSGRIGMDAVWA
jgi:hypothetical protein